MKHESSTTTVTKHQLTIDVEDIRRWLTNGNHAPKNADISIRRDGEEREMWDGDLVVVRREETVTE